MIKLGVIAGSTIRPLPNADSARRSYPCMVLLTTMDGGLS